MSQARRCTRGCRRSSRAPLFALVKCGLRQLSNNAFVVAIHRSLASNRRPLCPHRCLDRRATSRPKCNWFQTFLDGRQVPSSNRRNRLELFETNGNNFLRESKSGDQAHAQRFDSPGHPRSGSAANDSNDGRSRNRVGAKHLHKDLARFETQGGRDVGGSTCSDCGPSRAEPSSATLPEAERAGQRAFSFSLDHLIVSTIEHGLVVVALFCAVVVEYKS